jgi:hypothetical protein
LQRIKPDEETLRLILESIRGGADDSDEDEVEDEMQQVSLSCGQTICDDAVDLASVICSMAVFQQAEVSALHKQQVLDAS